jgi:hypothetical protein
LFLEFSFIEQTYVDRAIIFLYMEREPRKREEERELF